MSLKYYLSFLFIFSLYSCSKTVTNITASKDKSEYIGEPTCISYTDFGGYSFIYTDKCGCGSNNGFFGTYWNITCEDHNQTQNVRHDFNVGETGKWNQVIRFLKSREEQEAENLLVKVNQILKAANYKENPNEYYSSIKSANEYLDHITSKTFRDAFRQFLENEFDVE